MAENLSRLLGSQVDSHQVLIDAPPVKLEVQFAVDIYDGKQDCYRPLGDVSPVVRTLAEKQFDDYVKRVRVFVHPALAQRIQESGQTIGWSDLI